MYLQGAAIWHPRCGPGPTEASQIIFNNTSGEIDRMSNSAMSEIHVSFSSLDYSQLHFLLIYLICYLSAHFRILLFHSDTIYIYNDECLKLCS